MVPNIVWEEPWTSTLYTPWAGDVLITLDVDNFAEMCLWTGNRPATHTATRGAWILAVRNVRSGEVQSAVLDGAWASTGFRLLCVYKEAEGGLWAACDSVPVRISSRLAEHGLGWADATQPSAENVIVVIHTNNFPLTAPVLQARWWCDEYVSRFISNSFVLGIVDVPTTEGPTTRTLSCWVRGHDLMWMQEGVRASCNLPIASPLDRIEFEVMPLSSQLGARSSDISNSSPPAPSTGAN